MRVIRLTDVDIQQLIAEPKDIPSGLSVPPRGMTRRGGHMQKSYDVQGDTSRFVLKLRQSCFNPMDFSAILGYQLPGSYTVFRLKRYNGKHTHSNVLESQKFYGFHVHTATERYQTLGHSEDQFAEPTARYFDLGSAIERLLDECGFRNPLYGSPLFGTITP
jgi:hypothetical protein